MTDSIRLAMGESVIFPDEKLYDGSTMTNFEFQRMTTAITRQKKVTLLVGGRLPTLCKFVERCFD